MMLSALTCWASVQPRAGVWGANVVNGIVNIITKPGRTRRASCSFDNVDTDISVVGQNLLDNHHPEFGTSPLVRSPLVELRRCVYGKATLIL